MGYGFAILSCLVMGGSLIVLRKVSQHVNHLIFCFYMFLGMLIPPFVALAFTNIIQFENYNMASILLMVGAAIGGIIGQVSVGLAYRRVEASTLSPFWNLEIVLLCILENLFLDYQFTKMDFLGGL